VSSFDPKKCSFDWPQIVGKKNILAWLHGSPQRIGRQCPVGDQHPQVASTWIPCLESTIKTSRWITCNLVLPPVRLISPLRLIW
jgi:hypothetical protein